MEELHRSRTTTIWKVTDHHPPTVLKRRVVYGEAELETQLLHMQMSSTLHFRCLSPVTDIQPMRTKDGLYIQCSLPYYESTLDSMLHRTGKIDEKYAREMIFSLCAGLKIADRYNIHHGGISPSTVFITSQGPILGQFGPYKPDHSASEDMRDLACTMIYSGSYPHTSFPDCQSALPTLPYTTRFKDILSAILRGKEEYGRLEEQLRDLASVRMMSLHSQVSESTVRVEEEEEEQESVPEVTPSMQEKPKTAEMKSNANIGTPFAQFQFSPSPVVSRLLRDEESDFDYSDPRNSSLIGPRIAHLKSLQHPDSDEYAIFAPGELLDDSRSVV